MLECAAGVAGTVHVREVGEKPLKRLEEASAGENTRLKPGVNESQREEGQAGSLPPVSQRLTDRRRATIEIHRLIGPLYLTLML